MIPTPTNCPYCGEHIPREQIASRTATRTAAALGQCKYKRRCPTCQQVIDITARILVDFDLRRLTAKETSK